MISALKGAKELAPTSASYADQAVVTFPAISTVQDKLGKPERVPYVQRPGAPCHAKVTYSRVVRRAWVEDLR